MTNSLNGRLSYTGLRASVREGVMVLGFGTDEIVRLWHDANGFYVVSRELGSLGDSQITKIQVMFTINTLVIDFIEGVAFNRLWCDKIDGFELVMKYAEGFSGAHAISGANKIRIIP